jgi:hypothetical protein
VCISHANIALRELQKEIDHFGPANADAVVAASVALTGATQDWLVPSSFDLRDQLLHRPNTNFPLREQWAVFVDGYSKVCYE